MTLGQLVSWFKIGWPFRLIGAIVGLAFIFLLLTYLWLLCRDILAILHRYRVPRAELCRWDKCGLFDRTGEKSKCRSPFVCDWIFQRRKATGQKAGCRYSFPLAEPPERRRSALEYRTAYLNEVVNLRNKVPWGPILMFLAGLTLLLCGKLGWKTFIELVT